MEKNILKSYFIVSVLSVLFLSCATFANAQSSATLSVQPSSFHILINPGQKILESVLLVNQSSQTENLKVYTQDYKTSSNGTISFYYNSNKSLSAETWLVPQYTTVSVAPFDSKKIEYIVSVDKNMPGGGYDGAIIFQTYSQGSNNLGSPFGALVSIDVLKQGITTGSAIKNFSTPFFQYQDPTKIGFSVQNLGNSNLFATGTISVYNLLGKKINTFNAGQLDVLPGSTRIFNFQWTNSNLFGIYKTQVNLTNSMGKNNTISASSWFIFLPWTALLIVFLSLAIVFALIKYKKTFSSSSKKIRIKNTQKSSPSILSDSIMETSIKELFFAN